MNGLIFIVGRVDWQLFATFTFKSVKVSDAVRVKMFFAVMREQAENMGVHFKRVMWCLRSELGESTERFHFHALIAGLPNWSVSKATCFSYMKIWEKHGGGMARVRVFNPNLTGVGYTLKGVDEMYSGCDGNFYELNKFGGRCDVMLSKSLIAHLSQRSGQGKWRVVEDKHASEHTAKAE